MPTTTFIPDMSRLLGRSESREFGVTTGMPVVEISQINSQQVALAQLTDHQWLLPIDIDAPALIHALVASFSVILVSELGDKTFIITAIMAMKNSRSLVFIASALALFSMTVLSVGMGVAVTVIPKVYTHYVSIVLFLCFGIKMLKEAYDLNNVDEESEFDEVQKSLEKEEMEKNFEKCNSPHGEYIEDKTLAEPPKEVTDVQECSQLETSNLKIISNLVKTIYIAPLVIKVFTMVFVAEWGDRSQISTVILAAREDVVGVFVGSYVGHVLCTGLAVIGGRFVADMISVRTSKYGGGAQRFLLENSSRED